MTSTVGRLSEHLDRDRLLASAGALRDAIGRRVIGQTSVVEDVLMALIAGGHALLVGVPGLAKTLLVRTVADATHLGFRRVQFTPDLVPSDITGTEIMEEDAVSRHRSFRFIEGPVFTNILLADEINRAPPRTQAALLEAMQEHRVTAAGDTRALPEPFFVLATQNPIEQEGTYPLPEAQLDRFLFDIRVGYPDEREEITILRATTGVESAAVAPILSASEAIAMQQLARTVPAADAALRYAAQLVRATRPDSPSAPEIVRRTVRWGAGPRAGQALILGAKAHALLNGRLAVSPADIRRVALPVLRHRVLVSYAGEADGVTSEHIVAQVLDAVAPPASNIRA
jgi:MoxR-like ATPase